MNKTFLNFIDSQKLYRLFGDRVKTQFFYGKRDKQLYDSTNIFMGVRDFYTIYIPAYTDADLNTVLPNKIIIKVKTVPQNKYDLVIRKTRWDKYTVEYENQIKGCSALIQIHDDSEVEAKAKMILFLNKKNLLQYEN